MAARLAAFLGLVVAGAGLYLLVDPTLIERLRDSFVTTAGLWTAVALRVSLGILLWVCAESSRMPRVLKVLAVVFVLAGIMLPVIGLERMGNIIDWAIALSPSVLRSIGLVTVALGGFIVWAVWPQRRET